MLVLTAGSLRSVKLSGSPPSPVRIGLPCSSHLFLHPLDLTPFFPTFAFVPSFVFCWRQHASVFMPIELLIID